MPTLLTPPAIRPPTPIDDVTYSTEVPMPTLLTHPLDDTALIQATRRQFITGLGAAGLLVG